MNSNNDKNKQNKHLFTQLEDHNSNKESGVYMRDDHCDWGSSGLDQLIKPLNENN